MTVSLQKKTLRQKHIQGKDNHVMTAAETEVMHLQAKDPRMPANTRIKEEGSFPTAFRGSMVLPTS